MSLYIGSTQVCPVLSGNLETLPPPQPLSNAPYVCPLNLQALLNSNLPNATNKYIALIEACDYQTTFTGANHYVTSDGATYTADTTTTTIVHQWNQSANIATPMGAMRWVVAGGNGTIGLTSYNRQIIDIHSKNIVNTSADAPSQTTFNLRGLNDCAKLRHVKFDEGLTVVATNAFLRCFRLEHVELPSTIVSIGNYSFQNCYNLQNINLHQTNLSALGAYAFATARNLKNVSLPSTIKTLGVSAFSGTAIANMVVPPSVTSIGANAFENCNSLTSANLQCPSATLGSGIFNNCSNLKTVQFAHGMSNVSASMFNSCQSLKKIVLPSTVTAIGASAFYNCYTLIQIVMPPNLVSMGNFAFGSCLSLNHFALPSTLGMCGNSIFSSCRAYDGTIQLAGSMITVPERCCYAMQNLGKAILHEGITAIAERAFSFCVNLTHCQLPQTLQSIAPSAFDNCGQLSSLTLPPSCTTIDVLAFSNCFGLNNLTVYPNFDCNLDLSNTQNLNTASLEHIVANLKNRTTMQPGNLTLGSINLSKLEQQTINIAAQKNWTLT